MTHEAVLSIQSEVVRGHVGNGAARFALQRRGHDVFAVPTILLSNHPGYGRHAGEVISSTLMEQLVGALDDNGWLPLCAGVVSGYLGAANQAGVVGGAVAKLRSRRTGTLYLCDPVFGDDRGAYARQGVAEAMARVLLPIADIATPNRFELSSLTSRRIEDPADAVQAARLLGPAETVVTSVPCGTTHIGCVVVDQTASWITRVPRLENVPSGTGDLFAAIYLACRLGGDLAPRALQIATSAVKDVIEDSVTAGASELTLVASQASLIDARSLVEVQQIV